MNILIDLILLVGVLEQLLDFLGLPLFDSSGRYGFQSRKNLTDLLSLQINRTPRKQCFEDQVITIPQRAKHLEHKHK